MEGDGKHASSEEGGGEKGKVLVVILVGAPGSGKSTFCENVMRAASRPWVRICQDSIADGKAGTKSQCIQCASNALNYGKSVFIDRCNLDREQRADFVKFGGPLMDVHAVVLDLPPRLCISRSVKRTGHEGNLQGGRAAAVVNKMLQKRELPKLNEGFSRITFCQNEADAQDAVNLYRALGPSDTLSSGYFGEKSLHSKVQLGIMKFLKKVGKPMDLPSERNNSLSSLPKEGSDEKASSSRELEKKHDDKKDAETTPLAGDIYLTGSHTLAFPSISTADFQFNHEKASDIIVDSVADFLHNYDNVRLVLVDLSHRSNILSLVKVKAANRQIDPKRFLTLVGDITRLSTEGNLHCSVIANAANWRLKPGGGGVNAAIHNAAGEGLEIATKERAGTLSPGSSVVVPLPSSSPLYQREGVTHIIHVLGPNMNPQRPNCLQNDYVKGCKILRDAYSSLFNNFMSIVQSSVTTESSKQLVPQFLESKEQLSNRSHCSDSDLKNKREVVYDPESNKKWRGEHTVLQEDEGKSTRLESIGKMTHLPYRSSVPDVKMEENTDGRGKKTWSSWAQALHQTVMHPEQHKDDILEVSDDFVVLCDRYPKGKRHVLVLSRLNGLDCLADVRREHLPLLKQMHNLGIKWSKKFLNEDSSLIFRLGYHSAPSMRQLHLHVISQDFDSEYLKNKKHWNSFNTAFFRDSADALEDVEKLGSARLNDEKLLSMELRCHRCQSAHPNIPKLKFHLGRCRAPFPTHLVQGGRLIAAASGSADVTLSTGHSNSLV
ncbi:hypothetical protein Taro_012463 [Colocasia esculenta]|uniref:Macro domain-containing protein n=1 Tax=Colocasia esculenta TaxID=4460 RepID=A0A843U988_COLES|nr:hypothetical protein [Colocasia esculenta]